MTETQYTLTSDYTRICCAIKCLRDVLPETNPHIDREEYERLSKVLGSWATEILSSIKVESE